MTQGVTAGTLAFVLIGAVVALLWFELRNGKRSSKNKKHRSESTVI